MLFPLPFTAFESYMLEDDSPESPMSFYLRLSFWGTLDRRAFIRAVHQATLRHPLFKATLENIKGRPTWVATEKPVSIFWDEPEAQETAASKFIDLTCDVGLRVFVKHTEGQARVLLQFHHCCTDGIGATRFIEDLMAIYTSEQSEDSERPRLAPLKLAKLAHRGRLGLGLFGRLLRMPIDVLGLVGIAQFFGHRPSPLQTSRPPALQTNESNTPDFVSRRLTEEHLTALKAAAKRDGVTVNDLLIRDLLLTIDAWNARHNPQAQGTCTRISVPVNLRRPEDNCLPATNVVSMVFVDRRVTQQTNVQRLLKTIRIDTWFVKRLRMGVIMIWLLEAMQQVRGGFAWLLNYRDCMATAVLSNLGVQFNDLPLAYLGDRVIVGDSLLESIDFLPPIRRGTHASLGVVTYAGELMVSLQYDSQMLDKVSADDVLRLFEEQLLATAGLERTSDPATVSRMVAAA